MSGIHDQQPVQKPAGERGGIIAEIRHQGLDMLPWDAEARTLQARILSLRCWQPGEKWPDVSDAALLERLDQWLPAWLEKNGEESQGVDQLDMREVLLGFLDRRQRYRLEEEAPARIRVPGGSRRLRYSPGRAPILAVRVQELFGLAATPAVCNGSIPVTLHLLSPAQNPIQVTRDLHTFWNSTYQQARKELKRRYPRHYWPERPWSARSRIRPRPRVQR